MTCKCHPYSPFLWRNNPQPSIFMADHTYRAKGKSKLSGSEIASVFVEGQRKMGKTPGTIYNLGLATKKKEEAMLAFKQFGVYSRAGASKPNKHQLPKGKV
jgi:hypothetical protein